MSDDSPPAKPRFSASQRRLIRRRSRPPDEGASIDSELNIVPLLDVVINLILFLLLTSQVSLETSQVEAQLPQYGPTGVAEWSLSVHLGESGTVVSQPAGTYAPGCTELSSGTTIPSVGGAQDALALRGCAEVLAAQHPDRSRVTLSADASIPLEEVIRAMDALRGSPAHPLFDEVRIAAGIR